MAFLWHMNLIYGAPDTIRTCGLSLRRGSLYPTELRGLRGFERYNINSKILKLYFKELVHLLISLLVPSFHSLNQLA